MVKRGREEEGGWMMVDGGRWMVDRKGWMDGGLIEGGLRMNEIE